MEALVTSLHRRIHNSLRDLLVSGPSSHEKHLDKIFKILPRDFGDLFASQTSRENHVFCTNMVKSKTIFFSLTSCASSLSCPPLPLPKPPFSLTKPPFSSAILHQSLRIGMSFLLFSIYFKFPTLVFFGFCIMLRYGNKVFEYGFVDVLMSLIYEFCWFC